MRIVTYNVRYFGHGLRGLASTATSKRNIASAIAALNPLPEIVALQEVETRSIRAGVANRGAEGRETQLDAFMRYLGKCFHELGLVQPYKAVYFPAHVYGLGPVKLYTTGLAMLVNQQKLQVLANNGEKPHPITHVATEALRKVKQTRIAAHLQLENEAGKTFHLFNTHLSLPSWRAKEFWSQPGKMGFGINQLAEAKAVVDFAKGTAKNDPFLVVGDMNTAPATPVYDFFTRESGLRGAQEVLKQIDLQKPGGFSTAGFMHLRMHLDHVFAGGKVDFIDLEGTKTFGDPASPFTGLSDHVPLIANVGIG